MKSKLAEVLQITIYIWIGIQLLMGAGWVVCNLGKMPGFQESQEILAMSESLCVDEYTGYLYPAIVHVFILIAEKVGIPAVTPIYILQLVVAYFAYEYFLKKVVFIKCFKKDKLRKRTPIFVLFAISIPPILQVHMAVLSYSLASSLFIILLAKMIIACKEEQSLKSKEMVRMGILWVLASQICVDYAWIGGLSVAAGFVIYMSTHRQFCVRSVLLVLISAACIGGLNTALQTPGSMGKIQRSTEGVLLSRIVWPKFAQLCYIWEDDVTSRWNNAALMEISTFPEKVIYEFGPQMDKQLGYEGANKVYRDMIKKTLDMDTKYVMGAILKDGGAYICPPLTMYLQLHGVGSSYTGWNYGRMKDYSPRLAEVYVDVSLTGWMYIMLASVVLYILCAFPKEWKAKKVRDAACKSLLVCVLTGLIINVYYVIVSGHMQDYKKLLVISALWAFGLIAVLNQAEEKYYLR